MPLDTAITPPPASTRIVDKKGMAEPHLMSFFLLLAQRGVFVGTGSPEGVVSARQTQFYMDDAGTPGNIFYIKRDADDGAGDTTKGWILV